MYKFFIGYLPGVFAIATGYGSYNICFKILNQFISENNLMRGDIPIMIIPTMFVSFPLAIGVYEITRKSIV